MRPGRSSWPPAARRSCPPTSTPRSSSSPTARSIGSGHYKLVKYQPGVQAVLERNDELLGRAGQKRPRPDPVLQGLARAEAGDPGRRRGHRVPQPDTDRHRLAEVGESGLNVVEGQGIEIRYLVFNTKLDPGKDRPSGGRSPTPIDRQSIVDNVYNGTVQPLYSMIPAGLIGHTEAYKDRVRRHAEPRRRQEGADRRRHHHAGPDRDLVDAVHYGDGSADEYTEIKRQLEESGLFKVTLSRRSGTSTPSTRLRTRSRPSSWAGSRTIRTPTTTPPTSIPTAASGTATTTTRDRQGDRRGEGVDR